MVTVMFRSVAATVMRSGPSERSSIGKMGMVDFLSAMPCA